MRAKQLVYISDFNEMITIVSFYALIVHLHIYVYINILMHTRSNTSYCSKFADSNNNGTLILIF